VKGAVSRACEGLASFACVASLAGFAPIESQATSAERYAARTMRGWTVQVERGLEKKELGRDALELLDHHLYAIERAVPTPALLGLRRIPIWLSEADPVAPCACYHVSPEWLRDNGHDPNKARGVEIANAANFLQWTREQPSMVLHELAHGYHHQVLTYEHAAVNAAFESAVAGGKYASVLHWNARRQSHYALTNATEFFAEASEAWFGTNDFYPFVRAELVDFDPQAAAMLRATWGE
jgi:hypothetical protein